MTCVVKFLECVVFAEIRRRNKDFLTRSLPVLDLAYFPAYAPRSSQRESLILSLNVD